MIDKKSTIIYILSFLLVASLTGQLFLLGLKLIGVQSDISNQSEKIDEIGSSVDKIMDKLQANDIIFEE